MPKEKVGAGNFVQPNDDDGYDIFVNWKIVDISPDYASAVRALQMWVADKPIIRINHSGR